MNIALISTLYAPNMIGGAERVAQTVAEGLAAQGHRVNVISLSPDTEARQSELNNVQVNYCRLKNLYWPFPVSAAGYGTKVMWHVIDTYNTAMARSVGEKLDEIRPDVVNTHNLAGFSVSAWGAVKARRLPLVHTLHDHYLLCPYSTMFKNGKNCDTRCLGCRMCSAPRSQMTDRVDGVIGVSRFILQRHLGLGLFAGARAAVVHSSYQPPSGAAKVPTTETRLPLRIGFLGRLEPGKGLHRLVEAFLGLPRGAAELRIAGTGDPAYEASLRQRVGGRSDVRWLGFVPAETFLPGVHVLVVPSLWHEAMGRVVLEAFAYGVPVIGSNRGGIPELIDRTCGWIVDPDKPEELRDILRRCAEQPRCLDEMRTSAHAALLRFSGEAMMTGYLEAYRDAIQRSTRRQASSDPA